MAVPTAATRKGPFRRLIERSGHGNSLLAEAVIGLLKGWLAVRFLPFRHAVTSASRVLAPHGPQVKIDELVWAVRAASAHVPWRTVCFQQGLALQRMLRRRGVDARLHYGVGYAQGDELQAHVWISVDSHIVLGAEQAPAFKCVAIYPADPIG
jgi:hypothetical protein